MSLTYSGNLIRQYDRDRFLLSLLAPPERRKALWALFAFNYEIGRTREVVSETATGLIRLQWWRETIEEIYMTGKARRHEVLGDLAEAIKIYQLPRERFETLIYAREFDLEDVAPATMEGLINYADFTTTPLTALALQVWGEDSGHESVRPVSVNYALTGLVRAVSYMLPQGRCFIPQDVLQGINLTPQKIHDFNHKRDLPQAIKQICGQVSPVKNAPYRYLKVMEKLTKMHQAQLRAVNYDVFSPRLAVPPRFKELRLLLAS